MCLAVHRLVEFLFGVLKLVVAALSSLACSWCQRFPYDSRKKGIDNVEDERLINSAPATLATSFCGKREKTLLSQRACKEERFKGIQDVDNNRPIESALLIALLAASPLQQEQKSTILGGKTRPPINFTRLDDGQYVLGVLLHQARERVTAAFQLVAVRRALPRHADHYVHGHDVPA